MDAIAATLTTFSAGFITADLDSDGDMEKAVENLRKKGLASADKKMGAEVTEGIIASYIHNNSSAV